AVCGPWTQGPWTQGPLLRIKFQALQVPSILRTGSWFIFWMGAFQANAARPPGRKDTAFLGVTTGFGITCSTTFGLSCAMF
ncbi:MAG: hypothetical protein EBW14_13485, partial [Oxalobacteraceae bacterium]|nr:hypothetical protein [Oxalobacteraceae bacterium]